jgi:hypothetical protein
MKWPIVTQLFIVGLSLAAPKHAAGQQTAPAQKPENEWAEVLRAEADRSEKAFQATVAAVHELSGVLQAEASQSVAAARRDSEAIQHAMDLFLWIVGVVSAILVTGATLLAWALAAWGKASKTDIEKEVQAQTDVRIKDAIAADKARFDSMIETHLQQTKSDLTKAADAQIKDFVDHYQHQLETISATLEKRTKEVRDSVEVIAEAVENNPDEVISPELPVLTNDDAVAAGKQTISNAELSILKALWIKPLSRRTVYNIANDSQTSIAETRQVLSDLIHKGLVEALPHSRTGRLIYRRTGQGVALTDARFRETVAHNS